MNTMLKIKIMEHLIQRNYKYKILLSQRVFKYYMCLTFFITYFFKVILIEEENMNDIYLWNQKSLRMKPVQDLDINKIYIDHQRRGITIIVINLANYCYK